MLYNKILTERKRIVSGIQIEDFLKSYGFYNVVKDYEEYDEEYENLISENNMTNGEVNIAMRIIEDSYAAHMKNHSFIEDIRGYQ